MNLRSPRPVSCRLLYLFALAAVSWVIGVARASESLAIVDALVLYTPAAVRADPTNLPYWLRVMVDRANEAFLNSGVPLRVQVVHTAKVSHDVVAPTLNGVIQHLLDPVDGQLDEVDLLRERWNADVVILVAGNGASGFAAPLGAGATNAVVVLNSLHDFTLAKALGRLAGCGPDVGSLRSRGLFEDSRSHSLSRSGNVLWGTLMSEDLGNLAVFSNPALRWQGQPLGRVGVADNVRVLQMRAAELAGFRSPVSRVEPAQVEWVTPAADLAVPMGQPLTIELAAAQGDSPVVRVEILERGPDFFPSVIPDTGGGLWKRTLRPPQPGWHHYLGRVTDRSGWVSQVERVVRVHAPNDAFSGRQTVAADGSPFSVILSGSSLDSGEPERTGAAPGDGSVWFSCTPATSGELWISGFVSPEVSLSAWSGEALPDLTPAGVVTRHPQGWSLPVEAGRPLQFVFTGPATLAAMDLRLMVVQPTDNDRFERRRNLTTPATVMASFGLATPDPDFPWPDELATDLPALWWTWIPERSGIARLHVPQGAPNPWQFLVFRGSAPGLLTHFRYPDEFQWAEQHVFTTVTNMLLLVREAEPIQIAVRSATNSQPMPFRVEYAPTASNHVFASSQRLDGSPATALIFQPGSTEAAAPSSIGPVSLWFRWKAPESGSVFLSEISSGAARSVFAGESLETLQVVPTVEHPSGSRWEAVAGTTYTLVLHWRALSVGYLFVGDGLPLRLCYLPPNTRFDTRQTLLGVSGSVRIPLCVAPYEANPIEVWSGLVWYRWVAPESGVVSISRQGALGQVHVLSGTNPAALQRVPLAVGDDDVASFVAAAGVEYQIAFGVGDGGEGFESGEFRWRLESGPLNDAFGNRFRLGIEPTLVRVDLSRMTLDSFEQQLEPLKALPAAAWWSYTAPTDGVVTVSTPQWGGVFRLRPDGTLETLETMHERRRAQVLVRAGEVVEIAVGGLGATWFNFSLEPVFPDDRFQGRLRVHPESPPWYGTTQGHGSEAGEPRGGLESRGRTAWAGWQAGAEGVLKLSVDLEGPIEVTVYRGNRLEALEPMRVARGELAGQRLELSVYARTGEEFAFRMDSLGTTDSGFVLRLAFEEVGPMPSNDAFGKAVAVRDSAAQFTGSIRRATAEAGEPSHARTPAARSLWWKWTPPGGTTARLEARPGSPSNPVPLPRETPEWPASPTGLRVAVYTGASLGSLVEIASATGASVTNVTRLEFPVNLGSDYFIALDVEDPDRADDSEYTLQWFQAPSNDAWNRRKPLAGVSAVLKGHLAGATPGTTPWGGVGSPTLWWSWVAPLSGQAVLHGSGPSQTRWEVYQGGDISGKTPIASGPGGGSWKIAAGEVFSIGVRGPAGDFRPFEFELEALGLASNDRFQAPQLLAGESAMTKRRCEGTTLEPNEPVHGGGFGFASLWYLWVAPRSGWFRVTTETQPELLSADPMESTVPSEVSVYRGSSLVGLERLAPGGVESPSRQRVAFLAAAGTAYRIAVSPIGSAPSLMSGRRQFVHVAVAPAAPNLNASMAERLDGTSAFGNGDLQAGGNGLWWKWTAPRTGLTSLVGVADGWQTPDRRLAVTVWSWPEGAELMEPVMAWSSTWESFAGPVTFAVESGREYWIQWYEQRDWNPQAVPPRGSRQPFAFALNVVRTAAETDAVGQAELLSGTVAALFGEMEGATHETGEPPLGEVAGLGTLWWKWTAPSTGICNLRTRFPMVNLRPGVYRIPMPRVWEPVPLRWESTGTGVSFEAQEGETYHLALETTSRGLRFGDAPVWWFTHAVRPPADDFDVPDDLFGGNPVWNVTTRGATSAPGETAHGGVPAQATVWARWVPGVTGAVLLEISPDENNGAPIPRVAVYRGDTVLGLSLVGDNVAGTSAHRTFIIPVEAGVPYRIAANHTREDVGAFRLELRPVRVPVNDAFLNRIALRGERAVGEGSNLGATLEPGEPLGEAPTMGATLWWSWTALNSGRVQMQTESGSLDTVLAVYRGDRLETLIPVVNNDDQPRPIGAPGGGESQLTLEAEAGVTYEIQVGGVGSARGGVRLLIFGSAMPGPALTQSPQALPSREVRLQFQGTPGQRLWLESSTDLLHWIYAGEVRFLSETEFWQEQPHDWDLQKFYRVTVP